MNKMSNFCFVIARPPFRVLHLKIRNGQKTENFVIWSCIPLQFASFFLYFTYQAQSQNILIFVNIMILMTCMSILGTFF